MAGPAARAGAADSPRLSPATTTAEAAVARSLCFMSCVYPFTVRGHLLSRPPGIDLIFLICQHTPNLHLHCTSLRVPTVLTAEPKWGFGPFRCRVIQPGDLLLTSNYNVPDQAVWGRWS